MLNGEILFVLGQTYQEIMEYLKLLMEYLIYLQYIYLFPVETRFVTPLTLACIHLSIYS